MGTASVLIYITVALLVLLLISQSPQKSGKQKSDKDGKVNFKEFFHGLFDLVRNYDEEDHNATYQSDDLMEAPAKTLFAQLDKDGFFWGDKENKKKIHWRSWEKMCLTKLEVWGKNLYAYNLAMLAKQAWRLIKFPNSLMAQVFKARYIIPHCSFWEAQLSEHPSFSWRSILQSRPVLAAGVHWKIGNGATVNIWKDSWFPQCPKYLLHQPANCSSSFGVYGETETTPFGHKSLNQLLTFFVVQWHEVRHGQTSNAKPYGGLLASWSPARSGADFVVAKDGSGTHTTINHAVAALARMGDRRPPRAIIYVKSGVYNEKVEIGGHMKNVMLVGDGMDRTVITGSRSVVDGDTTLTSATFGVSGDGFWARDITFENTAGPQKHQAVALRVSSDLAVFYRCSIKGYQDSLYAHSLRQFYRDSHIYGTIDFIFGDAPVVLQNCAILVRRPLGHQSNMITAQGRDNPAENTGNVIHGCRVRPAREFEGVKGSFKTYLDRPWHKYSRTVFLKTDLDGLVDPKGWTEWRGSFAISTLYYGE